MTIKSIIYKALSVPLAAFLRRNNACIGLCYHRFTSGEGEDPVPGMAIDPEEFRMHLETLQELGPFISWDDVCRPSQRQGISFALSLDDGYRDNVSVLLPILESLNIPAAVFICGGVADGSLTCLPHDREAGFQPPLLQPADIQALVRHPLITVGSHTQTHTRFSDLDAQGVLKEIKTGKSNLEAVSGEQAEHFAVPYGQKADADWPDVFAQATAFGLRSVASNYGGWNAPQDRTSTDVIHIKRVSMGPISDPNVVRGWVLRNALKSG